MHPMLIFCQAFFHFYISKAVCKSRCIPESWGATADYASPYDKTGTNDNRLAYEFDGNNSDVNSDVGEMSQQ